jgi:hypothetical protein
MKEIDNIVKKVLLESLNEKADEITNKIYGKLSGEMEEGRFKDELKKAYKRKHPEQKEFPASLKKKYFSDDEDGDNETDVMSGEFDYVAERECMEGDCGEMEEELHGNQDKIDVAEPKGKITKADFDKLRSMKKETDEEMEEGNAFTGALAKAKEEGEDEFTFDGKEYEVKNESYFYSVEFDGEEITLSEGELIAMIEEIVLEEKKTNLKSSGGRAKGTVEYDRVHKKDEDINKKANEESFKKMRDYVKAGSKGNFETEPKHFPKGNGELGEMSKKAYIPSDAVEEYISDFAYPGQTNLTFDEIKPDDEKIEKYLKGDSTTGNSQEYANAVPSKTGEKFFKNYKDNAYGVEQKESSYKRVTAPVDIAGENKGSKTYKKTKAQKALDKLDESTENEKILTEEMMKMKNIMGYNKKTQ